jgi:3-oxoacyl-[acyl-carrier protein] reductase
VNITLTGRAAIVTGAARGIGLAIAQKLAGAGAAVVLTDVDAEALDRARVQIEKSVSGTATTIAGDLTGADFPQAVVDKALDTYGSVDILVNNAGYTWDNVIQKTTDAQFQAMLDIHVVAPFRMLRAASSWLRETAKKEAQSHQRVTRKVVNITSISGTDGNAGQAGYSSGKAAVVGLTKTMAKEWGRYQVTVNAVGFGLIDTRLIRPTEDPDTDIAIGERRVRVGMQAQIRDQVMKLVPLGRLGTPEDAANAAFFFCSPLSDYVTGEVLICGGGVHF